MFQVEKLDARLVYSILDAFEGAKDALAMMPQLPPGNENSLFSRSECTLPKIGDDSGSARVSDIARFLDCCFPIRTKVINEMVELGILRKVTTASDKRVVLVQANRIGRAVHSEVCLSLHPGFGGGVFED